MKCIEGDAGEERDIINVKKSLHEVRPQC